MKKQSIKNRFLCITLSLAMAVAGSSMLMPAQSEAAISSKLVKMLKGDWMKASSEYFDCTFRFDKNYCKCYKNGKVQYKEKVVSAKKLSNKKYKINMMGDNGSKYYYIGTVKKGRIVGLDCYFHSSGNSWSQKGAIYSGSSSMG